MIDFKEISPALFDPPALDRLKALPPPVCCGPGCRGPIGKTTGVESVRGYGGGPGVWDVVEQAWEVGGRAVSGKGEESEVVQAERLKRMFASGGQSHVASESLILLCFFQIG